MTTINWLATGQEELYMKLREFNERREIEKLMTEQIDVVNKPSHYNQGKVECIDALESATSALTGIEAVCTANVIKYLWRWKNKNGAEDLKKAQWYLNKLIGVVDGNPS